VATVSARGNARRVRRARQRELLWAGAGRAEPPEALDCTVRRPVGLRFAVGRAALIEVQRARRRVPARRPGRGVRRGGAGWLELNEGPAAAEEDEHRLRGALHVGRCGRAVPVEVVLAPWSTTRSEVRLQLYRRVELPAHYFAAAHGVLDSLRDEIHATAFRERQGAVWHDRP
jgi:hypothetical protein